MLQWCRCDQFNTSEWILWWYNGVKVTSSIPVHGYCDDTMVYRWPVQYQWMDIMMIQWCRGDQFHTSAWILWWYNGVKVTSSIPVNGYYDDTMVYRWPVPYQWNGYYDDTMVYRWPVPYQCMDIMMIQSCKGDQFHTSAWILWWYYGVEVTSSIPVNGYCDDTMV